MSYKATIGLEIHSELKTNSKMFCSCKNDPDEKRANFNVCPICMAHPGTLPVINGEAVKMVLKTGAALNCKLADVSKFDRKNYFYPDLPKGYQISQYDMPLCGKGHLDIEAGGLKTQKSKLKTTAQNSKLKKIRITRIHLEEDTGRLSHIVEEAGGKLSSEESEIVNQGIENPLYRDIERKYETKGYSLVDYNRAGVPLMELVTEPDMESGEEARKFAEELQLILRYLGVSSADMEKGQMRVEVNISLSDSKKLGTKVEIKNLNSFKVAEKAIDYEIQRQTEILEKGEKVVQETRGWHDKKEITFSQREKEEAHDYRYFPEPDLPTLNFTKEFIDGIKAEVPELPAQKRERFVKQFGLDKSSVEFFVQNKDLSEYFEKVASEFDQWLKTEKDEAKKKLYKLVGNYLISDIKGLLGDKIFMEKEFKITPENFAEFIKMIYKNEISSKIAKIVLAEMYKTGADPSHIIEEKGLSQITNEGELEQIVKSVIDKNKKSAEDYKKGKQNALQFLIGQVMKESRGKANPETASQLLKKFL